MWTFVKLGHELSLWLPVGDHVCPLTAITTEAVLRDAYVPEVKGAKAWAPGSQASMTRKTPPHTHKKKNWGKARAVYPKKGNPCWCSSPTRKLLWFRFSSSGFIPRPKINNPRKIRSQARCNHSSAKVANSRRGSKLVLIETLLARKKMCFEVIQLRSL